MAAPQKGGNLCGDPATGLVVRSSLSGPAKLTVDDAKGGGTARMSSVIRRL